MSRGGRTMLAIMSIVIGVAAIATVEMMAVSTRGASQKLFATVAGNAALTIKQVSDAPFDEVIMQDVAKVEGVKAAVPIAQFPAKILTETDEGRVGTKGLVLAVDPEVDRAVREQDVAEGGRFVKSGAEVVVEENFATNRDLKVGDEINILAGRALLQPFKIVGIVRSKSYAQAASGGLAFVPLDAAQQYFYRGRKQISAIQIVVSDDLKTQEIEARINRILPRGLSAQSPTMRTAVLEQTLFPTERGLEVAVVFIALLSAFIVFNTFMMNVSERRRQMAIMRAVGATSKQLFGITIRESLLLGLVGTTIGLLLGWRGAVWGSWFVGLLFEVDLPIAVLTWPIAIEAICFGMGITLVGALFPAWQASKLTPLEALSPIDQESDRSSVGLISIGCLLVALGGIGLVLAVYQFLPVEWGVYPALILLIGLVILAESVLLEPGSAVVTWLIRPILNVEGALARRQIVRHSTRSALTAGVIFIAAATGIGLSFVILDTVGNIRDWAHKTLTGDFYVRVALPDFASGESPETPEEFEAALKNVTGIREMDRARIVKAQLVLPNPKSINGRMTDHVDVMVGSREYPSATLTGFDIVEGDPATIKQQLIDGEAVVSSVIAAQAGLQLGDDAMLETPDGPHKIRVGAIANDYLVGGLTVWVHRKTAERLLHISGVDGYVIMVEKGQEEAVRKQLEPLTKEYGLLLNTMTDIRKKIDSLISGGDIGLWTLVVIEFIVASFGMVNTLTMSVLEQTRELGMLRVVAMTRSQVRRTILAQSIIIGLMGIVPGVLVGLFFAYTMNIATQVSIGHPIQLGFHPWLLFGVVFGSLVLVMIAALVPAYRASRIDVLKALQHE